MGYKKQTKSFSPGVERPKYVNGFHRPGGSFSEICAQGSGDSPMPQAEDIT